MYMYVCVYIYIYIYIWDCFLIAKSRRRLQFPGPPASIVDGRPPQLLSDALPLLWWVQNARCMHIRTFLAPAAGSF